MKLEDREVNIRLRADCSLRDHFERVLQDLQLDELRRAREQGRDPVDVTDDDVWNHLHDKWMEVLETCMVPEKGAGSTEIHTSLTVRSTYKLGDMAGRLGFKHYKHFQRFILDLDRRNNGWDAKE